MAQTPLRAVLVDDEEPARELLRALLAAWREIEIVAECGDGEQAVDVIAQTRADLVFLDIQMPGRSGLDIAAALSTWAPPPLVVFVTAYDQHAIRAFELSACDYLLKPFDSARLQSTIERVLARRSAPQVDLIGTIRQLVSGVRATPSEPIVLKIEGRHLFLDAGEIEWIEANGKETRVHTARGPVIVREPLTSLEARLDPAVFLRVQRSAIVNRQQIREIQPWFKGDYVLILRLGSKVTSGARYRLAVQRLLEI